MPTIINGIEIKQAYYNGVDLDKIIYNGATVFAKFNKNGNWKIFAIIKADNVTIQITCKFTITNESSSSITSTTAPQATSGTMKYRMASPSINISGDTLTFKATLQVSASMFDSWINGGDYTYTFNYNNGTDKWTFVPTANQSGTIIRQ